VVQNHSRHPTRCPGRSGAEAVCMGTGAQFPPWEALQVLARPSVQEGEIMHGNTNAIFPRYLTNSGVLKY
jgi:hypothetical protein